MSTPTLDRLNLEEAIGVADWEPEFPCEASTLALWDSTTGRAVHTPENCPNPAKLIIIIHTRKCSTTLSCADCYQKYLQLVRESGYKRFSCAMCDSVMSASEVWSEPI